jgi:hypothetical protein
MKQKTEIHILSSAMVTWGKSLASLKAWGSSMQQRKMNVKNLLALCGPMEMKDSGKMHVIIL